MSKANQGVNPKSERCIAASACPSQQEEKAHGSFQHPHLALSSNANQQPRSTTCMAFDDAFFWPLDHLLVQGCNESQFAVMQVAF